MSASTRWLVVVAGVVAVAVVASTVVALISSGEDEFPPGSPEATVQRYLRAVADRDATAALAFIADDTIAGCEEIPRDAILQRGNQTFRASLEETAMRAEEAHVVVSLTQTFGSPPFDGGESTWQQTFVLVREADEWRFTELPWPLYCVPRRATSATPGIGG